MELMEQPIPSFDSMESTDTAIDSMNKGFINDLEDGYVELGDKISKFKR